jgi:serine/threonine protein kinase
MSEKEQPTRQDQESPLDRLAAEIADGVEIDWARYRELGATSEQIRAFRSIAMLRTCPPGEDEDETSDIPNGYQVLELAGRGGYGRVLKAIDQSLGRTVALKILDPVLGATDADRKRFSREARTLAEIDHPNVVKIYSLNIQKREHAPPSIALALEWIDGHDLARIVDRLGPMHPVEATRVGIDLCSALQAMHDKSILHRDIKPQNLMRGRGGNIVLLDFGIARRITDEGQVLGSSAGTPAFEAPEVLAGGRPTPQSDLFSVGVLLYWLMTGLLPVHGNTAHEQRQATKSGHFIPLWQCRTDIPPRVSEVIDRAMALDPKDRPRTATQLGDELRSALIATMNSGSAQTGNRRQLPKSHLAMLTLGCLMLGAWAGNQVLPTGREELEAELLDLRTNREEARALEAENLHRWIIYPMQDRKPRNSVPDQEQIADGAYAFAVAYVAPTRPLSESGKVLRCPEDYDTIQATLDASSHGDLILVGRGRWNEALQLPPHSVRLASAFGPLVTTISAAGLDSSAIDSSKASLAVAKLPETDPRRKLHFEILGLTLTGGSGHPTQAQGGNQPDLHGGALNLHTVSAVVEHCVMHGNGVNAATTFGGGAMINGRCEMRYCVIFGNAAWACGGGIFALGADCTLLLSRCTVVGNASRGLFGNQGGVAVSHGGYAKISQCIIWGNSGEPVGTFGSYSEGARWEIDDSIISDDGGESPRFVNARAGDFRLRTGSRGTRINGSTVIGALRAE